MAQEDSHLLQEDVFEQALGRGHFELAWFF